MWISIALLIIAAALNVTAAIGAPGQSQADGYTVSVLVPQLLYAVAAFGLLTSAVLRFLDHTQAGRVAFVIGAVAVVAAPLVYGALTGQFTWTHHAVRLVIVLGLAVAYWRL